MKTPENTKPVLWGAAAGAAAMLMVGFWGLGWTTAGSAEKLASARVDTAVVAALVPFCVAKAQLDGVKLAKFHSDQTTSWTRSQFVRDAGWASLSSETSNDYALSSACSDRLEKSKSS